jgi:SpoVK/Ycf46/Vps4 family AAA+-type ATPase
MSALVKSFSDADDSQFFRVVLQVAAAEARKGHADAARELRDLVDAVRAKHASFQRVPGPVPIAQPRGDLADLLRCAYPDALLRDLVVAPDLEASLARLLKEHRQAHELRAHGLRPRRKLLLAGPPGTGKTLTAHAIAGELRLPLLAVRLETLITRFLGETAGKLRLVFDAMYETRGVYLFDEFDALGAQRTAGNDVGEIRRVLNSFLQFIDEDTSESLIIAATNHVELLDRALFRRFDSVLRYERPGPELTIRMMKCALSAFPTDGVDFDLVAKEAEGLAQADIVRACEEAAKDMVLEGRGRLDTEHFVDSVRLRRAANHHLAQP